MTKVLFLSVMLLYTCHDPAWDDDTQDAGGDAGETGEEDELSYGFLPMLYYDVETKLLMVGRRWNRMPPLMMPGVIGELRDATEPANDADDYVIVTFTSLWCHSCIARDNTLGLVMSALSGDFSITWSDVLDSGPIGPDGAPRRPNVDDLKDLNTAADVIVAHTSGEFDSWTSDAAKGEVRGYPTSFIIDARTKEILATLPGYPAVSSPITGDNELLSNYVERVRALTNAAEELRRGDADES